MRWHHTTAMSHFMILSLCERRFLSFTTHYVNELWYKLCYFILTLILLLLLKCCIIQQKKEKIYLQEYDQFLVSLGLCVIDSTTTLKISIILVFTRGGVRGGREGALAPPDPAQNFSFLCIKILCSYLFFTLLIFFKVQNL